MATFDPGGPSEVTDPGYPVTPTPTAPTTPTASTGGTGSGSGWRPPDSPSPGDGYYWTGDHWELMANDPRNGPAPPGKPGPGGGGGGLLDLSIAWPTLPTLPTFSAPNFTAPSYTPPPPFSYPNFVPPTYESAASDPGYQFAVGQGQKALETSAASRGVLNTGGTLKDLINYGQQAGAQQYQNVYNRDLSTYGTNYKTAADTYATNAQSQYLQPYQIAFQNAMAEFQPRMAEFNANANAANLAYQTNTDAALRMAMFQAQYELDKRRLAIDAES